MTVATNRVFRIERANRKSSGKPSIVSCSSSEQERHEEIMSALTALRDGTDPQEAFSRSVVETCQRDLQEAQKIKGELTQIHNAITETKREIATLHDAGREDLKVSRMTDELGAIVEGTEEATETILQAAEEIDSKATDLIATLRQQGNKDEACDIQEQVVKIFEACNFQDLTGQRITKVVNAFCFIEQRVDRMMEIWGGIEGFKDIEKVDLPERSDHAELLNGPALEKDENVASQDDIDALFD
ncbi:MAG: protein phosphatase CheZ [Alphaproteobacteria bacterium]